VPVVGSVGFADRRANPTDPTTGTANLLLHRNIADTCAPRAHPRKHLK